MVADIFITLGSLYAFGLLLFWLTSRHEAEFKGKELPEELRDSHESIHNEFLELKIKKWNEVRWIGNTPDDDAY